jgi:hypothetical protein
MTACAARDEEPSDTVRSPATSEDSAGMAGAPAEGDGHSAASASFADVYAVFEMHCGGGKAGCHVTGAAAGLEMPDPRAAYDHLVGVASAKCAGEERVVGGDADASVLVQALEGSSSCVKAMPLGRDPLSASELAMIRAWIDAGAEFD